ncbi:MAG TPA: hypothetical protein VIF61_05460 [Methylocystis sp.]
MFVEPILKRLEHKIQSTVSHASGTAIALVPLLVAVGFGTAAADFYLQERFSPPEAYLILCGAYLVVALVIYMVARAREQRSAEIAEAELAQMPIVSPVTAAMDQLSLLNIQRTLLDFAGRSGPAAAKAVMDQTTKNLHLLIGAGAGIYVASRIVDALNRRHGNPS